MYEACDALTMRLLEPEPPIGELASASWPVARWHWRLKQLDDVAAPASTGLAYGHTPGKHETIDLWPKARSKKRDSSGHPR